MTSFIIKAQENRPIPSSWKQPGCVFCSIIHGHSPAYRVYETDKVIAILDILPLRPGHTLVMPKKHISRLSELPSEYAAAIGEAVSKVAHALTQALSNTALNVVANQEYAQAIPHVHYHIIPAPNFQSPEYAKMLKGDHVTQPLSQKEIHKKEFEARDILDDHQAEDLLSKIRPRL